MSGTATNLQYTPFGNTVKTLLGITNDLELMTGVTPLYNTTTTLNAKYGVFPTTVPTTHPIVKYFGVGIGGTQNVDSTNLSQPCPVSPLDMDLFTPIPIRCVPLSQDLSPADMASYCMRTVQTFGGTQYALYYLKRITVENAQVQYTVPNAQGIEQAYSLITANLNPTPATGTTNGVTTSVGSQVNALVNINLPLLGSEILEAVNVIYNGNLSYAKISEIGLYTGNDQTMTATNASGASFSYMEAILAQLYVKSTNNGTDMSNPTTSFNQSFGLGAKNIVLL